MQVEIVIINRLAISIFHKRSNSFNLQIVYFFIQYLLTKIHNLNSVNTFKCILIASLVRWLILKYYVQCYSIKAKAIYSKIQFSASSLTMFRILSFNLKIKVSYGTIKKRRLVILWCQNIWILRDKQGVVHSKIKS